MLPGGTHVICMIYLVHVSCVESVLFADPAQPFAAAGEELDDLQQTYRYVMIYLSVRGVQGFGFSLKGRKAAIKLVRGRW